MPSTVKAQSPLTRFVRWAGFKKPKSDLWATDLGRTFNSAAAVTHSGPKSISKGKKPAGKFLRFFGFSSSKKNQPGKPSIEKAGDPSGFDEFDRDIRLGISGGRYASASSSFDSNWVFESTNGSNDALDNAAIPGSLEGLDGWLGLRKDESEKAVDDWFDNPWREAVEDDAVSELNTVKRLESFESGYVSPSISLNSSSIFGSISDSDSELKDGLRDGSGNESSLGSSITSLSDVSSLSSSGPGLRLNDLADSYDDRIYQTIQDVEKKVAPRVIAVVEKNEALLSNASSSNSFVVYAQVHKEPKHSQNDLPDVPMKSSFDDKAIAGESAEVPPPVPPKIASSKVKQLCQRFEAFGDDTSRSIAKQNSVAAPKSRLIESNPFLFKVSRNLERDMRLTGVGCTALEGPPKPARTFAYRPEMASASNFAQLPEKSSRGDISTGKSNPIGRKAFEDSVKLCSLRESPLPAKPPGPVKGFLLALKKRSKGLPTVAGGQPQRPAPPLPTQLTAEQAALPKGFLLPATFIAEKDSQQKLMTELYALLDARKKSGEASANATFNLYGKRIHQSYA